MELHHTSKHKKTIVKNQDNGSEIKDCLGSSFCLRLASTTQAQDSIFDITNSKYGEKPYADITEALRKAFADSCAARVVSKVVVLARKFQLKAVEFKGPCKVPIEFQVQGIIQAPEVAKDLIRPDTWISFLYISKPSLSSGGVFDGNGALSWKNNDCHKNKNCAKMINLRFSSINDYIIQDITCMNSKHFQINVHTSNNVTFKHVKVSAPSESVNTDGIHIGKSIGINILDTVIETGDDCVSICDGTKPINLTNLICGPGHDIAIRSLGRYENEEPVEGINVKNCIISNTSNDVRIKTWPTSLAATTASDIHFKDITMNNVPSKVKRIKITLKNIRETYNTPLALKLACSKGLPCEGVEMSDIDLRYKRNKGALTSQCTNVKPTITNMVRPLACVTVAFTPSDKADME